MSNNAVKKGKRKPAHIPATAEFQNAVQAVNNFSSSLNKEHRTPVELRRFIAEGFTAGAHLTKALNRVITFPDPNPSAQKSNQEVIAIAPEMLEAITAQIYDALQQLKTLESTAK